MNDDLKASSQITNATRENYQKQQKRLKSDIALGEVIKTNRRYETRKKLLKGLAVILAFSSLMAGYDVAKSKEIESKNFEKVISYSSSSETDTVFYDSFGNEVEITPKELIKPDREQLEGRTIETPQDITHEGAMKR